MNLNTEKNAIRTILFILVMAVLAQLCAAQLAHGQERFIASASGVTCELRREATVVGAEIRFRQIARWSDADKGTFDPIADLIVAHLGDGQKVKSIQINDLRMLLRDAGVNSANMNFAGAVTCTVTRSDAQVPAPEVIEQRAALETPGSQVAFETKPVEAGVRTLRDLLTQELATRLNVAPETLQINFRDQDDKIVRQSEPQFSFQIDSHRGTLGDVSWSVTVTTNGNKSKAFIPATARVWQNQLVVSRPLSARQLITEADVVERRALVDRVVDDALLTREQAVGQNASRELKPGAVLTAKLVEAAQLVRPGQFVTIEHGQGAVKVKIVARAIDGGTYGQAIRVRNEATREIMRVTITGTQEASLNGAPSRSES